MSDYLLKKWEPEDPAFWKTRGSAIANRNLWISIPALMLAFAVWSLMTWAQHVVTFRGDAAQYVAAAPFVFRMHLFMGMSLFVIFPFTRLVHVWSGFASVTYLSRAWQFVRPR
jgi:respiratory nitrate reductase gamma subunit